MSFWDRVDFFHGAQGVQRSLNITGVDYFYSGVAWIFSTGRTDHSLAFTRVESSTRIGSRQMTNGCAVRRLLRSGGGGWQRSRGSLGNSLGGASERLFSGVCVGASILQKMEPKYDGASGR